MEFVMWFIFLTLILIGVALIGNPLAALGVFCICLALQLKKPKGF